MILITLDCLNSVSIIMYNLYLPSVYQAAMVEAGRIMVVETVVMEAVVVVEAVMETKVEDTAAAADMITTTMVVEEATLVEVSYLVSTSSRSHLCFLWFTWKLFVLTIWCSS